MPTHARLVINGAEGRIALEPERSLLHVLREELRLTGAKYGCGEGVCGACAVLLDGEAVRACVTPVASAADRTVTTIEGLSGSDGLHRVQRAFVEAGAMQCGYCTPGMVVTAVALLRREPQPDDSQIRAALEGNICRCCAYTRIVRAVRRAAVAPPQARGEAGGAPGHLREELPSPGVPWDLVPAAERRYFDLLPDGLVAVLEPSPDTAPAGGAWIHVGTGGAVTAFTGKVDVGQDNRTGLGVLVAEELRLPPAAVEIVMGDTDVCPFDRGTAGSRSIVDAGQALRTAAAGARLLLVQAAARRWGTSEEALVAAGGRVHDPAGTRSAGYGELVESRRQMETISGTDPLTPPRDWQTAGGHAARRGLEDIVTGARRYPTDIAVPGMLHGKVLRPPSIGATLRSVDVTGHAGNPDVTVVREGSFVGVLAPDPLKAQRALDALQAEWDPGPPHSDRDLVEHLRSHPVDVEGRGTAVHNEIGDPDRALGAAQVRVAGTYTAAFIAHVPMETRVAVASWEGERVTVRVGTQMPFRVRRELAEALDVAEARVRVIVPPTGGGFGGKHTPDVGLEAARLARAAGKPVKVRWSREEELTSGYLRPAAVIDVDSGAALDGSLTAWSFSTINAGPSAIHSPYEIPNQRTVFQPAASPLRQGSYRALAATVNHFARESHIDELAHRLDLDPLELRLRHLQDERIVAVLRAAAERASWAHRRRGGGTGTGIAVGAEKGSHVATCAEVRVEPDGRLHVLRIVTAFECGAIVDPDNLTNQVEGATIMGLGGALFEAIRFDAGRIETAALSRYRVPRTTDVPSIEVVLLDRRDLPSAGGGETPIVAVAPALANAIFDATGVRLRSMPLAPDGFVR